MPVVEMRVPDCSTIATQRQIPLTYLNALVSRLLHSTPFSSRVARMYLRRKARHAGKPEEAGRAESSSPVAAGWPPRHAPAAARLTCSTRTPQGHRHSSPSLLFLPVVERLDLPHLLLCPATRRHHHRAAAVHVARHSPLRPSRPGAHKHRLRQPLPLPQQRRVCSPSLRAGLARPSRSRRRGGGAGCGSSKDQRARLRWGGGGGLCSRHDVMPRWMHAQQAVAWRSASGAGMLRRDSRPRPSLRGGGDPRASLCALRAPPLARSPARRRASDSRKCSVGAASSPRSPAARRRRRVGGPRGEGEAGGRVGGGRVAGGLARGRRHRCCRAGARRCAWSPRGPRATSRLRRELRREGGKHAKCGWVSGSGSGVASMHRSDLSSLPAKVTRRVGRHGGGWSGRAFKEAAIGVWPDWLWRLPSPLWRLCPASLRVGVDGLAACPSVSTVRFVRAQLVGGLRAAVSCGCVFVRP